MVVHQRVPRALEWPNEVWRITFKLKPLVLDVVGALVWTFSKHQLTTCVVTKPYNVALTTIVFVRVPS